MAKMLDCYLKVNEFEFQLLYYVHFRAYTHRERHEPPYSPSYVVSSVRKLSCHTKDL